MCVLVAQSCLTLCDPIDCSPPDSSVHGILQARILEWVAISFSSFKYSCVYHMKIIFDAFMDKVGSTSSYSAILISSSKISSFLYNWVTLHCTYIHAFFYIHTCLLLLHIYMPSSFTYTYAFFFYIHACLLLLHTHMPSSFTYIHAFFFYIHTCLLLLHTYMPIIHWCALRLFPYLAVENNVVMDLGAHISFQISDF